MRGFAVGGIAASSAYRPEIAAESVLCLGITGHRAGNPAFSANRERIEAALHTLFESINRAIQTRSADRPSSIRVHSMLADGTDQMTAQLALTRGWKLVSPLPFGRKLNAAINAHPTSVEDARAILEAGEVSDPSVRTRANAIFSLLEEAVAFELADRDGAIARFFLDSLSAPGDIPKAQLFAAETSERVALASRIVVEQSDIVIAVWDGEAIVHGGGTGHTIAQALELGAPVIWIDANAPESWRILRAPESLACAHRVAPATDFDAELRSLLDALFSSDTDREGDETAGNALAREQWHSSSNPVWHGYRRIEILFGSETWAQRLRGLRQTFEHPDKIAEGSAATFLARSRAMPDQDLGFVDSIERNVLRRFAWFDGVSSYLSDNYRGGMIINFLLAPLAIIAGTAYLPFATPEQKWAFALIEFLLLLAILALTAVGTRRRWHGRWFETRRVAEYLRHAPIMLILGVARPRGRWPRGVDTSWPERFAQQVLRDVGLPRVVTTGGYLRIALRDLLDDHVIRQRDYHVAKAARLTSAHENLDRFSSLLFVLAVVFVVLYLASHGSGLLGFLAPKTAERISFFFTFLGVMFPTFGGAVAGVRYFGDFERFAAISEVAAEKLDAIHARIALLLSGPDDEIRYARVAELINATDEVVVTEIENWQAVFGGKHITVPV